MSKARLVAGFAVLTLVLAACGDDGGGGGGGGGTPEGPVLIGADGLLSTTFVEIPETQGMFFSGPALAGEGYEDFLTKYEAKAGTGPIQSFHAHAYDATNLLFAAIEEVAVENGDGSLTISRQGLRDALYDTDGYNGLTGTLSCNAFGDCAQPAVSVYENEDPAESLGGVFSNVRFTSAPEGAEDKTGSDPGGEATNATITIAAGDPIKLAALQSISGATAALGTDQVTAIEVAIDDKKEIKGHPITLQSEDDTCGAEGGQAGAEKIVADKQIVGVIGTSCSGAQRAAMPILERNGYVMISGSNTAPDLTATNYLGDGDLAKGESWRYGYFRVAHNDEFQGQGAAQFAYEELGLRKVATIHDGDPYTQGLTTEFGKFFEAFGGEIVLATSINKGDTDMGPVLTEIQAQDPDGIYFPIFQPEGDFVVKQARQLFAS